MTRPTRPANPSPTPTWPPSTSPATTSARPGTTPFVHDRPPFPTQTSTPRVGKLFSDAPLVVHPPSSCDTRQAREAGLTAGFVASTTPPDERVAVRVPVGRGSGDGRGDLVPGLEAATFEGEGAEHLQPGLDQVEIGGIGRLEDEFPARMGQREQQDVGGAVDVEVVEDGMDALDLRREPGVDLRKEVDPVGAGAPAVRRGECLAGGRLEGAEDVAFPPPAIIDLLGGS